MPRSKRQIEHAVEIDGFPLVWRLHREQQWYTSDGWKGVAIHVCAADAEGRRRELHLEYPAMKTQRLQHTHTDRVVVSIRPGKIEEHIRQAMEAGWDPASRGKPFVFEIEELPH